MTRTKKKKASSNEVPAPSLEERELLGKIIIILKTVKEHAFPQSLKKKKREKILLVLAKDSKKLFNSQLAQKISPPTFEVCQNSRRIPAGS